MTIAANYDAFRARVHDRAIGANARIIFYFSVLRSCAF